MKTERVVWRVATAGVLLVVLGGCGGAPSGGSGSDPEAVHVRYRSVQEGGDSGGVPQSQDVIAQGDRFRMSIAEVAAPQDVQQTVVWDGRDLLLIEGQDASREANPPLDQRPPSFFLRVGDATFDRLCPDASKVGPARVAGRSGTLYSCPAHGSGDGTTEAAQITVDDETGLLLRTVARSSSMEAVEVDTDVHVDATTFSTEIPSALRGPDDATDASGNPLPLMSADSIPKAGGGQLLLADVRHGPSLVVIGELAGVTEMLAQVLPRTSGGTAPRVYVLLNPILFDEGTTGDPELSLATEEGTKRLLEKVSAQVADVPVPVGIDIKGGAAGEDLRSFEELMAGTTVLAAIEESGSLAWRMSDDELARSHDRLDAWIAANT